jgi:hypothetical protein
MHGPGAHGGTKAGGVHAPRLECPAYSRCCRYGLKGLCAYAHHAEALGFTDERVYAFVAEALRFLSAPESATVPACLAMALRVGESNMIVMEMLSRAHSSK